MHLNMSENNYPLEDRDRDRLPPILHHQNLDRGPKFQFPSYGSFISSLNTKRESGSHSFSSPLLLPALKQ
ncbi:hypothetical protein DNTS_001181, partial [Danionella cerebrum]